MNLNRFCQKFWAAYTGNYLIVDYEFGAKKKFMT